MQLRRATPILLALSLAACSGGGGGGGSGGDPVAALDALGLAPLDLGETLSVQSMTTLHWATDDLVLATLGPGCPTATAGSDDDSSGVPDSISIDFDCTIVDEGLAITDSIFLAEFSDPAEFFTAVPPEYLVDAGVDDQDVMSWGMSGSGALQVTGQQGSFGLQIGVHIAEFPAKNKVVFFIDTTIPDFPLASAQVIQIFSNMIFTLPADDSSDVPTGYLDSYLWDVGGSSPFAIFECQLLGNGTIGFDVFDSGDDNVASGLIDLAHGDETEISFD